MSWHPIHFQGMNELNYPITEQLDQSLTERENHLAHQILNSMKLPIDKSNPLLSPGLMLKPKDAVEELSKRILETTTDQTLDIQSNQMMIKGINQALWEFTELLEGSAVELFQQVKQIPIDQWHSPIAVVVQSVTDILLKHLDHLIKVILHLEKVLGDYSKRSPMKAKSWFIGKFFKKTYLDSNLLHHCEQTKKFIGINYQAFHRHFEQYIQLSEQVEESIEPMKAYPILAILDMSDQNLYVDVFRLLKMLELNKNKKNEMGSELNKALKHLSSNDHVIKVFKNYLSYLTEALFKSSLEWKSFNQESDEYADARSRLQIKLEDYQQELNSLKYTMSRYRTFLLKNDPNPYIRSRFGFTEWIVGPEPEKAKRLKNLIYSAEELGQNFSEFLHSINQDFLTQQKTEFEAREKIDRILHEMGQPLISQMMIRRRAESLLEQLKLCKEISNPHFYIINYIEEVLSKAMREDWKYHVLHQFPLFHQIYREHLGMVEKYDDPTHAFRIDRFTQVLKKIQDWIEKENIYSHVHEIEMDMNDLKTYLQDFLAAVQRAVRDKSHDPFLDETEFRFHHNLLEYRYLFGQFFTKLNTKGQDLVQLRQHFLFVDHYFESVENLLKELKSSWEGKH